MADTKNLSAAEWQCDFTWGGILSAKGAHQAVICLIGQSYEVELSLEKGELPVWKPNSWVGISCLLRCILSWQHTTLLLTGMVEREGSLETPSCDPLDKVRCANILFTMPQQWQTSGLCDVRIVIYMKPPLRSPATYIQSPQFPSNLNVNVIDKTVHCTRKNSTLGWQCMSKEIICGYV